MRIAARAPNHLGDGVMALPALRGLADVGELTVHAPRWGPELYRRLPARVVPIGRMDADLAVLFPPSLRAALEARRCRRRVGTATDARGWLLTEVVPWTPNTARLYRTLVAKVGAVAEGPPSFQTALTDQPAEVPAGHVGIAPLSATGSTREWGGFRELADRLEAPVVFYGGPGEEARIRAQAGSHTQVVGTSLGDLAATWARCAVLVTNDSGLAHFGRAVGVPVVTVFGSTAPQWTGAPGALAVEGPPLPCRPCRGRWCRVGGVPCLDVPVDTVLTAVREVLGG